MNTRVEDIRGTIAYAIGFPPKIFEDKKHSMKSKRPPMCERDQESDDNSALWRFSFGI